MKEIESIIHTIKTDLEAKHPFLETWTVTFDNSKRRAGLCNMTKREISFSRHHVKNNLSPVIRDTILHEFAHAIAFERHGDTGHGFHWKNIAQQLGATPKAKGNFELPVAPWLLVHHCPKTFNIKPIAKRFRRNKKIKNYFLIGRPDTQGELYFIKQADFYQFEQGLIQQHRLELVQ